MRVGIYCSIDVGEVKDRHIPYIACDNGLKHLLNQNIRPEIVIGDMDSLESSDLLEDIEYIQYPSVKDDTDTAIALKYAIERGYTQIDLYGVTKKRLDHFLAVLILLRQYHYIQINIYDEHNKIYILNPGSHKIDKGEYPYFSIFSFDDTVITLEGFKYPLSNYLLKCNDPLCVSNEILDCCGIAENDQPILVIQSI